MPRSRVDALITQIADYVMAPSRLNSELALRTAHLTLLDTLGCALLATDEPDAVRTARPLFASAETAQPRVIGTGWRSDPVQAAFANGTLIRWLDFNDAWLALEWGHPSDNFGALLTVADHMALRSLDTTRSPATTPTVADLLVAGIQAYEIQGVLALGMALNRHGLDHVANVRIASAAVATRLLGGGHAEVTSAITHAWADGGALRSYRHAPNVTARKSWAAGDATSRGVRLAYLALRGEEPVRSVLTTPVWGFSEALLGGATLTLERELGSYIMENVLLKPAYPTEYHAQTAAEAAVTLRPQLCHRTNERDRVNETAVDGVARIEIRTHEAAVRIISKSGPLTNPADRDHCLEYIVAVALLHGEVTSRHYYDEVAADPRIDRLRALTHVTEDAEYSRAYLDPAERAVANALRVHFIDGGTTDWVEVRIPLGHPARRTQAEPYVTAKLRAGLATALPEQAAQVASALADPDELLTRPVSELMELVTPAGVHS